MRVKRGFKRARRRHKVLDRAKGFFLAKHNLYNIAKRYGTTVGAIQKANGISGAMIRPGQSLAIPR